MKVLIAADSFKGSASSKQVAAYLAAGIREAQADVGSYRRWRWGDGWKPSQCLWR